MPAYDNFSHNLYSKKNINAYALSEYGLSLPSAANLTENDVEYICNKFIEILINK